MDQTIVQTLVVEAAEGQESAWSKLWLEIEPLLMRLASSPRVSGRLSQNVDDCRNIVVEVMARLRDDQFRRLRMFLDSQSENPDLEFIPWLRVVARRVIIDYLRGHGHYIDRRRNRNSGSAPGRWVEINRLTRSSRLDGIRPPVTNTSVALSMLRYAYSELPADQLAALERWIIGAGYSDIAGDLQLEGSEAAKKLVRAALQRLRREFRGKKRKGS